MGRDEYPVTIISAIYLWIRTEGGICGNQQSTYENHDGKGGIQPKGRMSHKLVQKKQVGTKENLTLVPGRYDTTLDVIF